jgi:hypothetical protein
MGDYTDRSYVAFTARKARKLRKLHLDCGCSSDRDVHQHVFCDRLACKSCAEFAHDCSEFGGVKSGSEQESAEPEAVVDDQPLATRRAYLADQRARHVEHGAPPVWLDLFDALAAEPGPPRVPFSLPPEDYEALYGPTVRYNEGGWYEIAGMESWHGSDAPGHLRSLLADAEHRTLHARAQAVLDFVTQDEVPAPPVDAALEPDPDEVDCCGNRAELFFGYVGICTLPSGHEDSHADDNGTMWTEWRTPVPLRKADKTPWWSRLLPGRRTRR